MHWLDLLFRCYFMFPWADAHARCYLSPLTVPQSSPICTVLFFWFPFLPVSSCCTTYHRHPLTAHWSFLFALLSLAQIFHFCLFSSNKRRRAFRCSQPPLRLLSLSLTWDFFPSRVIECYSMIRLYILLYPMVSIDCLHFSVRLPKLIELGCLGCSSCTI